MRMPRRRTAAGFAQVDDEGIFPRYHRYEPLQFQKQLRLQEARQLMLNQSFDAVTRQGKCSVR
jgi:hypothetical protein